ncbi:hypothetical protein SISSUDRAFT_1027488 [Sistotremastrum suecicum HHB10207 ss-3]|uniref:DUF7702 domain-containing protein n=1 Tax=Sistotremastrum suecicum HHB10207 ss-3 TaxID=1314776 RepID=A0A165YUN7_9AGAM|nr:hypothetical protein SISSUDRAFT_1027488 [Sistotremastrum suecicum HHB10207 ss-3]
MHITTRGIVSIVQIIVYLPLIALALILVFRHGFSRESGWIFLAIFSLIRIVGAALILILENESSPSSNLVTASSIVVSIGLTPLLFAVMGFLTIVAQRSPSLHMIRSKSIFYRLLHLAITAGLILSVVSATKLSSSSSTSSDISQANNFRKIAGFIFTGAYLILVALHLFCWMNKSQVLYHRRKLLLGLSCAVPFVGVRVAYTLIGSLQSFTSNFSPINGSIVLYVAMSVAMEFIAIFIYVVVGISIPTDIDSDKEQILEEQIPFQAYGQPYAGQQYTLPQYDGRQQYTGLVTGQQYTSVLPPR